MRKSLFLFIAGLFSLGLFSQNQLQALYSQGKYEDCLAASELRLEEAASDSMALFFQGLCQIQAKDYAQAYESLKQAEKANFQPLPNCQVQQALCLAQLKKPEEALQLLEQLTENGFANHTLIQQEAFAPLENNQRFQSLKDSIHRRSYPCYYDPNYTHFDFWVGEWEVYVGSTKVGENTISKQEGGCAVLEQYTTARDYVGQSYNYYDPADELWKQIWIDKTGGISNYVESERKDGYLQFISTDRSRPASYANLRMTFSQNEDGSVRQHIEQQAAENQAWQTVFDGRYVRKTARE